ncbi:heavy-metal-associated domain-containing protein [Pseudomonas sp. 6D_7.1_Bac1]|jgi:mercuric ion binding protein|uniref:heavy-metal-associated domain-containing protein n=1 Tax=Pseudomonas sp. 6D_7.1_Bac1 TaxID=2971615 RepID=UPI0021C5F066|nr:cation transporter [Pseudomonas sp. 6D_7.1_Bac1]MCU1748032.1 hypothetical protein [Pseudomonas sp. 6D_7.1_Bac1]
MRKLLMIMLTAIPFAVLAATPKTVKVDFDKKTATVTYDADQSQPEALTGATTNAGYPSTVHK